MTEQHAVFEIGYTKRGGQFFVYLHGGGHDEEFGPFASLPEAEAMIATMRQMAAARGGIDVPGGLAN